MEFRRKIPLDLTLFPYKLRTIQTSDDLRQVQKLRRLCFAAEIDKEVFDLQGDHLVVEDIEKNIICGTYRLTHSNYAECFECEEDFNIQALLEKKGPKLELAWACIHPEYRNGSIISLLWRGVSEVIKATPTQYIFGTTSIKDEVSNISLIQKSLQGRELPLEVVPLREHAQALKSYELAESRTTEPSPRAARSLRRLIPGLMRAYLVAGALFCAQPSYDPDLNCFDFMTVIDMDQVSDAFLHHYKF